MDDATEWWLIATGVMIIGDYVSGMAKAIVQHNISSQIMRNGLWHKFAYVMVVGLAAFLQIASQHINLGYDMPLIPLVCGFIVMIEVSSIIENLAEVNPEIYGSKLLQYFNVTKTPEVNHANAPENKDNNDA